MSFEKVVTGLSDVEVHDVKGVYPEGLWNEGDDPKNVYLFDLRQNKKQLRVTVDAELVGDGIRVSDVYKSHSLYLRLSKKDESNFKVLQDYFHFDHHYLQLPDSFTIKSVLNNNGLWSLKLKYDEDKYRFTNNCRMDPKNPTKSALRRGDKIKVTFIPRIYVNVFDKFAGFCFDVVEIKKSVDVKKKKKEEEDL